LKVVDQVFIDPGGYDIGKFTGNPFMPCFPFIHMDTFAKLVELIGRAPFIITEIMQVDGHPHFFEHDDTVHHVDSAAVISGPWYI
jgi:hypothetical protein